MAFASTTDSRPSVLGNLTLMTGTFTNTGGDTGGAITLATHMDKIVACGAYAGAATAGTGAGVDGVLALVAPTLQGLVIQCVADQDGHWWALGKR
tara:strand:+ start:3207 stop:3491 length:285 start_codon:yes stop_codon:yes gene_type:complete